MINTIKRKHGSIFRSIFGILVLLLILAMACSFAVMFFVRGELKAEYLASQERFIDHCSYTIGNTFESIDNLFIFLQSSKELDKRKAPSYLAREDRILNDQAMISLLANYISVTPNVEDVFICFFDYPYLYTKSGIVAPDVYYQNRFFGDSSEWSRMLYEQYDQVTLRKFNVDKKEEWRYFPSNFNTPNRISRIMLIQSIKGRDNTAVGTICVVLSEQFISSLFQEMYQPAERQIYVCTQEGQLIASNCSEEEFETVYALFPVSEGTKASRYISRQGLFSRRQFKQMHLECIVYTPQQALFHHFDSVFTMAVLLTLLAVVLLLVYAYLQSRRMYRPFRDILFSLNSTQIQDDEADYIAHQILKLQKDNQSMSTTLESSGKMILQAVLYKAIMGNPTLDDLLQPVHADRQTLKSGMFMVVIIRMDLPAHQEELFFVEYRDTLYRSINSRLDSWLLNTLETRPDEYAIILSLRNADEDEPILEALHQLAAAWGDWITGAKYYIGVSEPQEGINGLRSGFQQAQEALSRRPVRSEKMVCRYRETNDSQNMPFIPEDLEQRMQEYLSNNAGDQIIRYVRDVLDKNLRLNVSYDAFFSVSSVINQYLFRKVRSKDQIAVSSLIHLKPEDGICSAERCAEIVFSNLEITVGILGKDQKVKSSFIDQAVQYVDEHFFENINLDIVAQALGCSANHLSRTFKLKSNISFTDYLNGKRVAYAKEKLISTSMNLQEIALQCGFSSSNQLIRVFEKYEGITPNEYRKRELPRQRMKTSL